MPTLVAALEYAEAHCRPKDTKGKRDAKLTLYIDRNKFAWPDDYAQLQAAIPANSIKFALDF